MRSKQAAFFLMATLALLVMSSGVAHAVGVPVASFDTLVSQIQSRAAGMEGALMTAAKQLFAVLLGIDVVISVGRTMFTKDWAEMFQGLAWIIIRYGVFWYALLNWPNFSLAIVNTFAQIGNSAATSIGGTANMMPSGIFYSGANVAGAVWHGMDWTAPALSILLAIAGLIVLVVYAIIVATMIELLAESYIVAYAGIMLMGFGGARYTQNYAEAQIRYAISVGVKRLVLQILIGLMEVSMTSFSTLKFGGSAETTWSNLVLIIGMPIVFLTLAMKLPYRAQDMVNGSSSHGGGGLISNTAAVAAGVAAAAVAAAGIASAVGSAFSLASEQISGGSGGSSGGGSAGGDAGGGGSSGAGAGASGGSASGGGKGGASKSIGQSAMMGGRITAKALGNLAKAGASDVGQRLSGNYSARHGSMSWRMASNMEESRDQMQSAREKDDKEP